MAEGIRIEFDTLIRCANYFDIAQKTVEALIETGDIFKGFTFDEIIEDVN